MVPVLCPLRSLVLPTFPPVRYKLPPPNEEIEELNKKQLAAFWAEYWDPEDMGHLKETTEEEGAAAFPLPANFGKTEEDEAWANCPLKNLINTPEGYIWVPATTLLGLRDAASTLDEAKVAAESHGAHGPLVATATEKLQLLEKDIQQLEFKDEQDMIAAEAVAAKAAKKIKKAMKKGKKK